MAGIKQNCVLNNVTSSTFVVDLSVVVDVSLKHHLVNFSVRQSLAQIGQHVT